MRRHYFSHADKKKIITQTVTRLIITKKKELEQLTQDALYIEKFKESEQIILTHHPTTQNLDEIINTELKSINLKKRKQGPIWEEFHEQREYFFSNLIPLSNLIYFSLSSLSKKKEQKNFFIDLYFIILPEHIEKLVKHEKDPRLFSSILDLAGLNLTKIKNMPELYDTNKSYFMELFKRTNFENQKIIITDLLKKGQDKNIDELLSQSKLKINDYPEEIYHNFFELYKTEFKDSSKTTQYLAWEDIKKTENKSHHLELLQNADFDFLKTLTPEKIYRDYWELIKKSKYFKDKNLIKFANIIANSQRLKPEDLDDEKDSQIEKILIDKDINLDNQRRENYATEIITLLANEEKDISYSLKRLELTTCLNFNKKNKITNLPKINLDTELVEEIQKTNFPKDYWQLGEVNLEIILSTLNDQNEAIIYARLSNSYFDKIKDLLEILNDNYNLKEVLLSGKHKEVSSQIKNILTGTNRTSLFELESELKTREYTLKKKDIKLKHNNIDIYIFMNKTPLTIYMQSPPELFIPIQYSKIIDFPKDSQEEKLNSLIQSGNLIWNKKKVKASIQKKEESYYDDLVTKNSELKKHRAILENADYRYKQLCYINHLLDNNKIPLSLNANLDLNLIEIQNQSDLFIEVYNKLFF
jgi:hypothetical protein